MDALNVAQSILKALSGIFESRLEMFSLEMAIEKRKVALLLGAVVLAAGFLLLAFTFAGVFLILLAPDAYRVYVACGWMLFSAALAALCVGFVVFALRKEAAPFVHTREELRKDIACLGAVTKLDE